MTAFAQQSIEYKNESSFGDPTDTTMSRRIPVTGFRETQQWARLPDQSIFTRQNESRPAVLGPREAEIEISGYIPGGNAVPSSALSEHWYADLLGNALGGNATPNVQQLVGVGSDADTVVNASNGGYAAGIMYPIGVRGTRGGGRFIVVASTTAGLTIQSLVALPAAPNSGDQVWDALQVYPTETPSVSQAFLHQWGPTASGPAYYYHGAFCTGIKWNLPIGGLPTWTHKYKCAVVTGPTTATYPSVSTLEDCRHGPVMNGLCFVQTRGTTTHAAYCPIEVILELDIGTHESRTLCGTGQYQTITGWSRLWCKPKVTLKFASWDTTWNTLYTGDGVGGTTFKHILFQSNADATGRRFAFYMPNAYIMDPEPFPEDANGVIGNQVTFMGTENVSPENATDIAKSAIRFAFA